MQELNQGFVDAHYNSGFADMKRVGVVYSEGDGHTRAITASSKVVELDPHDADTYYNRGVAYSDISELDLAIQDYTTVIQLEPGFANGLLQPRRCL